MEKVRKRPKAKGEEMIPKIITVAAAGLLIAFDISAANAQQSGGTLKIYHRDTPPSASIHEEATTSTVVPFMSIFNNLVIFDQHQPINSLDTIVPDLGKSWEWNADHTELTFQLQEGVKWHDGEPFTSADVKCTWDMLMETDPERRLRKNPRSIWYQNVEAVTPNGDHEVTFKMKRPQPAFLSLLASGYTPIYPCHVGTAQMRTNPVGTGPFKFDTIEQNQFVRVTRNEDYWKEGRPYLDAIEYTIIPSRSTRVLAFTNGEFDLTWPADVTLPLLKDVESKAPGMICETVTTTSRNVLVNREAPPFDDPDMRRAFALALDRQAFIDILTDGHGLQSGAMIPDGVWGVPRDILNTITGFGDNVDVEANREEARKIMESKGYGPDNPLKMKVSTRNIAIYRDPAVILMDHLSHIYVDAELEIIDTGAWFSKITRKDYVVGMNTTGNGVDDPDAVLFENYACGSSRNYSDYCDEDIDAMLVKQSMISDQKERQKLVWEIQRVLEEDLAKPMIMYERAATCWKPELKGFTLMQNNSYTGFRFEDVWLDR